MKFSKIRILTTSATLTALSVILYFLSARSDTIAFTIYGLPLLLAGIVFGPVIGGLSGLATGIITQALHYGFTITTPLWLLAPLSWGLVSGIISHLMKYQITYKTLICNCLITSFICFAFNTLGIYLDGLIFEYPVALIYTTIILRLINATILSFVFSFILKDIAPRVAIIREKQTQL